MGILGWATLVSRDRVDRLVPAVAPALAKTGDDE
jgi:hypothetical protein